MRDRAIARMLDGSDGARSIESGKREKKESAAAENYSNQEAKRRVG